MNTVVKTWAVLVALGTGSLGSGSLWAAATGDQAKIEFFEMKIRPLLADNCYACHTNSKMGGLSINFLYSATVEQEAVEGVVHELSNCVPGLVAQVAKYAEDTHVWRDVDFAYVVLTRAQLVDHVTLTPFSRHLTG